MTQLGDLDACPTGKVRFETGEAARENRRHVLARRRAGEIANVKRERSVYYCTLCGGWHLTSRRTKKR